MTENFLGKNQRISVLVRGKLLRTGFELKDADLVEQIIESMNQQFGQHQTNSYLPDLVDNYRAERRL